MHYYDGNYWCMHFIWIGLLIWTFFTPYSKPNRKPKGEDTLEILKDMLTRMLQNRNIKNGRKF
jgi:hypothetical protein